jgi:hypothetical protein
MMGSMVARDQARLALAQRDTAYAERAILVVTVARIAQRDGLRVWIATDEKEPEWPVLFIELPTGQVSWHLTQAQRDDLDDEFPVGQNTWDNHTTEEKYERLLAWSESLWRR